MILEEITLSDEESKRKAIQDNVGRQAILNDIHEMWCHCKILRCDNQVYQVKIGDGRGERQLHYHDLNQLIVIENYSTPDLIK